MPRQKRSDEAGAIYHVEAQKGTGVVFVLVRGYSYGFGSAECHVKSEAMNPGLSTT
jgi:hypothetical protein